MFKQGECFVAFCPRSTAKALCNLRTDQKRKRENRSETFSCRCLPRYAQRALKFDMNRVTISRFEKTENITSRDDVKGLKTKRNEFTTAEFPSFVK